MKSTILTNILYIVCALHKYICNSYNLVWFAFVLCSFNNFWDLFCGIYCIKAIWLYKGAQKTGYTHSIERLCVCRRLGVYRRQFTPCRNSCKAKTNTDLWSINASLNYFVTSQFEASVIGKRCMLSWIIKWPAFS